MKKQKEYREATKHEKQEYDKSYRELDKEKIKDRRQEKSLCEVCCSFLENVIPHDI